MDSFLSKRPTLEQRASQPPCKKPKPAAKQGKVSALVRVASVRPEIRFRFRSIRSIFSDPVPVRFRPNADRIDRIWLSPGKDVF